MMICARIRGVRAQQQGSPVAADGATFQRSRLRESQHTGPTVRRHARRDFVPDHAAQEMRAGGVGENASLLLAALGETFSMACCPHHASGDMTVSESKRLLDMGTFVHYYISNFESDDKTMT
jgi:hypothetical protein